MPVLGKSKKEVVTEFRTAELLEAARRVFAEKGFHEATVDDVAEEAGVAKGTVYLYYRSKRDLYWAALKHGISSMHAETRRRMQQENTIEGKLHAFIATKIKYFEVNRDFFQSNATRLPGRAEIARSSQRSRVSGKGHLAERTH